MRSRRREGDDGGSMSGREGREDVAALLVDEVVGEVLDEVAEEVVVERATTAAQ